MTLPTAEEITNYYLYGTSERPDDLTDTALLNRVEGVTIEIDVDEYMASGPGRFFSPIEFNFIDSFFSLESIEPGSYEKEEILLMLGYKDENGKGLKKAYIAEHQFNYGVYDPDYLERTYIWGSTTFKISDKVIFIVNEDGSKEIQNFAIVPHLEENFDFVGAGASSIANGALSSVIDPSGIGKKVNFKFIGNIDTKTLTQSDYESLKNEREVYHPGLQATYYPNPFRSTEAVSYTRAGFLANEFVNKLFYNNSKPIAFLHNNKPILYGSHGNDVITGTITSNNVDISSLVFNIIKNPIRSYITNGITYVTGNGNDKIEGTRYNDKFIGGEGHDIYIIQNEQDEVIEYENEGEDEVRSSVSYTLSENVENLTLLGTESINATGNKLNNKLRGNDQNNQLKGEGGIDTLIGGGGADRLEGGKDSDIYLADSLDTIFDSDGLGKVFLLNKINDPTSGYNQLIGGIWQEGSDKNTFKDTQGNTYLLSGTTLIVNGGLKIEHFVPEGFSLNPGESHTHLGITLSMPKEQEKAPEENNNRKEKTGTDNDDHLTTDATTRNTTVQSYHLMGGKGDDTLIGGLGDDLLDGGEDDDYLEGGKGNDILIGGDGSNRLFGGEGNDWLYANEQIELDTAWGNENTSTATGKGSLLSGGKGNDAIVGSTENDVICSGEGSNQIYSGAGDDIILLNQNATSATKNWEAKTYENDNRIIYELIGINGDFLSADSSVANVVYAGAGNDFIIGSQQGLDSIYGGIGNDSIYAGASSNLILGEDGNDIIHADTFRREYENGYLYSTIAEEGEVYGDDTLDGGEGDDSVIGGGGNDVIYGGSGNDTIYGDHVDDDLARWHSGDDYVDGGEGNDVIYGGKGNDTILGAEGDDYLVGDDASGDITLHGDDFISGGDGNDKLWGNGGNDTLLGGDGIDTLFGGLGNDVMYGGNGDDSMQGDDNNDITKHGNDYMEGGAGKDSLWGMGGDDTLLGGDDDDYLDGGEGDNYLYGEAGNDTLNAVGSANESDHGNNYLDGGIGNDILISGFGADTLIGGEGADQLVQFNPSNNIDNDNDYLDGGDGNDTLSALTGNNTLIGGKGNDVLVSDLAAFEGFRDIGVIANDYLDGGEGDDYLMSAGGQDTLIGGVGNDTYSIFLKENNTVTLYEQTDDTVNNTDWVVLNGVSFEANTTKIYLENDQLIIETPQGKVVISNYSEFEYVQFTEGALSMENLFASIGERFNHAPKAHGELENQQVSVGEDWHWTIPGGSFTDQDKGDTLTFEAFMADGSALPDWLVFDSKVGTFTGTAPDTITELDIIVAAIDSAGAWNANIFTLEIIPSSTNQITGTNGNDRINGTAESDIIYGLEGNDSIYAAGGNDTVHTGDGYNYIEVGAGNDLIVAGSGSSTIYGGLGNDTFIAGTGGANVYGDEGDDTYQIGIDWKNTNSYNKGISINDNLGSNSVVFGEGISLDDFTLARDNSDNLYLYAKDDPNKQRISITNFFKHYNHTLSFADGTVLTTDQIKQLVLQPTDGNDYLQGYEGNDSIDGGNSDWRNDTIKGGAGDDTLSSANGAYLYGEEDNDLLIARLGCSYITMDGGTGDDTYLIEGPNPAIRKASSISIDNNDQQGNDTVVLAAGIDPNDFYIFQKGNDLELAFKVNKYNRDTITLKNYFTNPEGRVNTIVFADGTVWDANYILSHITDPIDQSFSIIDNESVTGGIGNDYFDIRASSSQINGGEGVNYYNFSYNCNSTISASKIGQDELYYGSTDQLEFIKDYNSLVIKQRGFTNQLTIKDHFTTNPIGYINNIEIEKLLKEYGLQIRYEDVVLGDNNDNYFITGNDYTNETVRTFGGDDTINGGYGDDFLEGGEGQDTYLFNGKGDGNDTIITGESGLDTIQFNDLLSTKLDFISREGDDLILVYGGMGILGYKGIITVKDHFTNGAIGQLKFTDGIFTAEQLITQYGISLSNNNDHIIFTSADDKIHGLGGNDYLDGAAGNDTLYGDTGDDTLMGGIGNDYLDGGQDNDLLRGDDGDDLLISTMGNDTIYGGLGNDIYDITLTGNIVKLYEEGNDTDTLILNNINYHDTTTKITQLANGNVQIKTNQGTVILATDYQQFEYLQFADTTIATSELTIEQEPNHAPVAVGTLADQGIEAGANWQWTLPEGSFIDQDVDDQMTYQATLADGSALPDWLDFDSNTATFTGRASNTVGSLAIIITAYDKVGETAQQQLTLNINNATSVNLTGTSSNDLLFGKANRDTLRGGAGDDTLIGSGGNDQLQGGTGADTYLFKVGDGQDTITTGDNGIDTIVLEGNTLEQIHSINRTGYNLIINYGNNDKITVTNHFTTAAIGYVETADQHMTIQDFINSNGGIVLNPSADTMTFSNGDNLIYAGAGNDRITAGVGNDTLYGEAGNDSLVGGAGEDILNGGIGNDTLNGGVGADTYVFKSGDGQDTINTGDNGIDTVRFEDITIDQIRNISRTGNNLIIEYGDTDKITVTNHFTTASIGYIAFGNEQPTGFQDFLNQQLGGLTLTSAADTMTFANGDNLIYAGAGNDRITAGVGNDTLYGEAGNDSLVGGARDDLLIGGIGNDTLNGGTGNDTYIFGRGDAQDQINNLSDTWQQDNDKLLFQEGVAADQLWFQKSGNNLIVSVIGTTDKVTINNWYRGDQYKLDSFELANGEALLANQVDNLVNAMATFSPPASGQTSLSEEYQNKLNDIIAVGWS